MTVVDYPFFSGLKVSSDNSANTLYPKDSITLNLGHKESFTGH